MQPVADDCLHAALPVSTACLLVCENVLERHHMAGKCCEIALCIIDDCEPLVQFCRDWPVLSAFSLRLSPSRWFT